MKEAKTMLFLTKISFSNRISPSGLVPRFPNSLKPFSIVSIGIIV